MFRERFTIEFTKTLRVFLVVFGIGVFRVAAEQWWNGSPLHGQDIVLDAVWLLVLGAGYACLHALWEWLVPFARRCHGFGLVLRTAYRNYWRPGSARAIQKSARPFTGGA
jgi:hypothetical protein